MINFLPGINTSASALQAERIRMDVIAENIANANTTRGPDGKPFQRKQVIFESVLQQQQGLFGRDNDTAGVRVARVEGDKRTPRMVYQPGHPDADAQGMVAMPNINLHEEMADLILASRSFEANLAVIKNARTLALQTLAIGKR